MSIYDEKRESMNADQLDFLRKPSVPLSIKRSISNPQECQEKPLHSKTCQNILLAATIIQFLIIISGSVAFAFFGYNVCQGNTFESRLKGKHRI